MLFILSSSCYSLLITGSGNRNRLFFSQLQNIKFPLITAISLLFSLLFSCYFSFFFIAIRKQYF